MSQFAKYLGDLEMKVGEDTIKVRPLLKHKQKLLGLNKKKELSEEDWAEQHKVFKEILKSADSEATEAELDAFLMKHDIEFMLQLFVGFGWVSSSDIEVMKSNLKEELRTNVTAKKLT